MKTRYLVPFLFFAAAASLVLAQVFCPRTTWESQVWVQLKMVVLDQRTMQPYANVPVGIHEQGPYFNSHICVTSTDTNGIAVFEWSFPAKGMGTLFFDQQRYSMKGCSVMAYLGRAREKEVNLPETDRRQTTRVFWFDVHPRLKEVVRMTCDRDQKQSKLKVAAE